jgi:hypothetical protein
MADAQELPVDKVARARELGRLRTAKSRAAKKALPTWAAEKDARNALHREYRAKPEYKAILACKVYGKRRMACPAAADLHAAGKTAVPLLLQDGDPVAYFDVTLSQWREARVLAMITTALGAIKGCRLSDVPAYASLMPWDYLRDIRPIAEMPDLFVQPLALPEPVAP